ncbi:MULTISPECIES: kelch repeat-containing protein [unclassified Shewanella]|uniref:Kelch repeat-containing protein n=1 Tax=unclassified Shewanella TaxID=196818 RepID=UPI000C829ACE|nr:MULTISPECIES: kelch repeat-containing protein [unclassified Shewanella]MDO6620737.1 kelch repeat-containing protein [Shewanella sp. 6_MG-2023]PMG42675.1 galactose oxidase [Shewanella sp. 10N.286.52.B9]
MKLPLKLNSAILLIISAPIAFATYAPLPESVSNNAIAKVTTDNAQYLLSFTGLAEAKDYLAVHNKAWALDLSSPNNQWQPIKDVPFVAPLAGRLASIAVGVDDQAYVFGGYTVAKNHEEISTVDNYRFDISANEYQRIADMPVAVDDTAASVYQQRYVYLFGGWHNDGNVNLVQVYDTQTDTWSQASPIPAPAVFGQAVAMVNNKIVLCDGVKVQANIGKRRSYASSPVCLYGELNPENHLRISWQLLPHYSVAKTAKSDMNKPAIAHYRMAATGVGSNKNSNKDSDRDNNKAGYAIFIGGSDNPYNYSGIGYNGAPSTPQQYQYSFDFASNSWLTPIRLATPSMDHRGLICHQDKLLRIGGMVSEQKVSNLVLSSPLKTDQGCTQ